MPIGRKFEEIIPSRVLVPAAVSHGVSSVSFTLEEYPVIIVNNVLDVLCEGVINTGAPSTDESSPWASIGELTSPYAKKTSKANRKNNFVDFVIR